MAQSISIKLEGLFEDEFHKQLIRACYKYQPKSVAAALKKLSLEQFVELMETAIIQSGCSSAHEMSDSDLKAFAGIYDQILRNAIMDVQELRSIIPKDIFITNSRVANELRHMAPNEEHTLTVGRKGSQLVEITTTINFNDKNIQFSGNASITPYDKIVHDAVCSLYSAGNDTFTPEMVYRAMNGMIESEFVSPKSIKMIVDSLEKQRNMRKVMLYLNENGVGVKLATRIYNELGEDAVRLLQENPYRITDIKGIGFLTADEIAQKIGFGHETYVRLKSGLLYTLLELSKEVIPYVIGILIVLLLCAFITPLCTWLPSILV